MQVKCASHSIPCTRFQFQLSAESSDSVFAIHGACVYFTELSCFQSPCFQSVTPYLKFLDKLFLGGAVPVF